MFFDLVLAVTLSPAATPAPRPLGELKTIASVRSTPFCTALRDHVAPAIAGILGADEAIDASPAHLIQLARDSSIFHDYPRSTFDIMHLESLITPLVRSTQQTQRNLDAIAPLQQAQQIRAQLDSVLKRQKDALNIISGLVGTYQMGEVMHSLSGPPQEWLNVLENPNGRPPPVEFRPATADPSAVALLDAAPHSYGVGRGPEFDPNLNGLGHSAFTPFIETMQDTRFDIAVKERDASQIVIAAAAQCRAPAPSTP